MQRNIGSIAGVLSLVLIAHGAAALAQEESMSSTFVVLSHLNGRLALNAGDIDSAWRNEPSDGDGASVRLTSRSLTEPKTLTGDDAEAFWSLLNDQLEGQFVFVSHLGGTLAIPRRSIRTAFLSEASDQLRLVYDGDPSGKVIEGEEALEVFKKLTQ